MAARRSTIDACDGELAVFLARWSVVRSDPIRDFRWIAIAEGLSFLLLLGIAMPLKYLADMPLMVRIVGSLHGGLFVLYVLAAFRAAHHARWSGRQLIIALVASLLPFGPFVIDHKLKEESATPSGDVASSPGTAK
jgi:integral membrane protein